MRFDERLRISNDIAYEIEMGGGHLSTVEVVISSRYHVPLALCIVPDEEIFVRAATGAEVTDALSTGYDEADDPVAWYGDTPNRLPAEVSWREGLNDPVQSQSTVLLWAGEIILKSGQGIAGPFYVHEMAASAWAFTASLEHELSDVFDCHIVPYACVRQFAPALLCNGDSEIRRLRRFDISPLRSYGVPRTVLPPA